MMLNSITNYKRLLLALVCGSMSCSTLAKVYSWRDTDGAMHYSQFPRQIVEKNAAQSRASRKQADMDDVVNELSSTKANNLLDGLDDIVANANVERQAEKVLTRRDPQLILIEQQIARQQAEQRARLVAKQAALAKQNVLITTSHSIATPLRKSKQVRPENSFMAGIHKRVYGNVATKSNGMTQAAYISEPIAPPVDSSMLAVVDSQLVDAVVVEKTQTAKPVVVSRSVIADTRKTKPNNAFLAGIKKKLNRQNDVQVIEQKALVANQHQSVRLPSSRNTSATNKALTQSADQIKAIESEISSNSQPHKVKAPSTKQVNSALMLSRLSYNHNVRLPLSGAGTNQLDRQGIDVSSQFVNEVNRSAE